MFAVIRIVQIHSWFHVFDASHACEY